MGNLHSKPDDQIQQIPFPKIGHCPDGETSEKQDLCLYGHWIDSKRKYLEVIREATIKMDGSEHSQGPLSRGLFIAPSQALAATKTERLQSGVKHDLMITIKRLWNVLRERTGCEIVVIPPHILPERQFEHWVNLNIEDLPVVCAFGDLSVISEDVQRLTTDYRSVVSAVVLVSLYMKKIITELKKQSDAPKMATLDGLLSQVLDVLQTEMRVWSKRAPSTICLLNLNEFVNNIEHVLSIHNFEICKTFSLTEVEILVFVLGFNEDTTEKIIPIDDQMILHQSPLYFFLNFVKEVMCREDNVDQLGFSLNIESEFTELQSKFYWAQAQLEDMFLNHPILSNLPLDNPDAEVGDIGVWVTKTLSNGTAKVNATYQEIVTAEGHQEISSENIHLRFNLEGHTLLYHGTSQGDEVLEGIDFSHAALCQDFSHRDGFYLHESYEAALHWAKMKIKGASPVYSVIIYRVHDQLLLSGLDLSSDDNMWLKVVKFFRTGGKVNTGVPLDYLKSNRYPFIKGPICKNGLFYSWKNYLAKPAVFNGTPIKMKLNGNIVQQYCLRSKDLASNFSYLPCGVIKILR